MSLAVSSELILQTKNPDLCIFLFFSTLFIYNFQRIIRIQNGIDHIRKEWSVNHQKLILFLMGIGLIICLKIFLSFKPLTKIIIIMIGFISLAYPTLLRKIPFLKIFIISLAWASSTTLLLAIENNILLSTDFILHFISRFLFVFAITIPFDIRDLRYDNEVIITLPLFFGIKISKIIAISSLFFCCLISLFQYVKSGLIFAYLSALIILYFFSSIFIIKSNEGKSDIFFSFWVESLSIMSYVLIIFMLLFF
jgi:4-hydroxybenzoate polyprenyltransferase